MGYADGRFGSFAACRNRISSPAAIRCKAVIQIARYWLFRRAAIGQERAFVVTSGLIDSWILPRFGGRLKEAVQNAF
jgi:hypothetical protein